MPQARMRERVERTGNPPAPYLKLAGMISAQIVRSSGHQPKTRKATRALKFKTEERLTGRESNRREVLTCGAAFGPGARTSTTLKPTRDKADRAHTERDDTGLLKSARQVNSAKPRRYPVHQMTSRGVAFDSSFDELHARQLRLNGSDLGRGRSHGGSSGITAYQAVLTARARRRSLSSGGVEHLADAEIVIAAHEARQLGPDNEPLESS